MIRVIFRGIWRMLILLAGASLLWFAIFKVYPYADTRLPAYIVLLLLYAAFAYVVIPTLVRILRLFDKPNHIPLYAITSDGWPSDPVNIAIVAASREHLTDAMVRAGWYVADRSTLKNGLKAIYTILFNRPYPTAPFSTLYLFGRPFDIGFEKPANPRMSPRSRHHVRFWRLEVPADEKQSHHFHFWHTKLKHLLGMEKEIWIGAAIEDTGIFGIRWRSGSLTHQISADTEAERDLIISDLAAAHQVQTVDVVPAGEPFSFRGQTISKDSLICEGILTVVELRGPMSAAVLGHLPKK